VNPRLVSLAVALAATSAMASSEGCARGADAAVPDGPIAIGYYDADVATGRRACPRTEVGLSARAGATLDIPNFYGLLGASALLSGSWAQSKHLELFATAEILRYQYGINASIYGSSMALGQVTAGATYVWLQDQAKVVGASARLMLPTSTASVNVRDVGIELGVPVSFGIGDHLAAHGYGGFDLSGGLSYGPIDPRYGILLLAGVEWAPIRWASLVFDASVHFGDRAFLDYVAPTIAARFRVWGNLGAELGATVQLLGDRSLSFSPGLRAETQLALRLSWRI